MNSEEVRRHTSPAGPSPKLVEMLRQATPEQLEQAIKAAAFLLNRRAQREATGQTDLTKPFDPDKKAARGPAALSLPDFDDLV